MNKSKLVKDRNRGLDMLDFEGQYRLYYSSKFTVILLQLIKSYPMKIRKFYIFGFW